jgi:hypothetical protein
MGDADPWELEERFWLDGPAFFGQKLHPACVMAFPGIGVIRAADILEGLKGAPRWVSVEMRDRLTSRAGERLVVLGYGAEARREGEAVYRCLCTSTYLADGVGWKLVQHQQSPVG